ncbi:TPA: hypothetical protein QCG78_004373 [Enterobacter asburiae]|nr:hypothetical protein [Enterobacter asburiae]
MKFPLRRIIWIIAVLLGYYSNVFAAQTKLPTMHTGDLLLFVGLISSLIDVVKTITRW